MSRIPQPSSSRTSLKPPTTPGKSRIATTSSPSASAASTRTRTISTARSKTPTKPKANTSPPPPKDPPAPTLSIKEAIALKRAEAKKAQAKLGSGAGSRGLEDIGDLADALPEVKPPEEEDLLGRLPVRDTIEQARSTALFEIHLGLSPDPLKSVPNEPVLPPSEPKPNRRGGDKPAWFEAQDLTVLKAWNNDIQEIQHEISLFGSLKTIDLHKNKLSSLPNTFADLTALTVLDLSYNSLTTLPDKIFALPNLSTLNISHNILTSLPFNAPFAGTNPRSRSNHSTSSGGFFTPEVVHATTPLPHLLVLDASDNKISADSIDDSIPVSLTKLDLSGNPLGLSQTLLRNLASLKKLKEVKLHKATIGDDSFPPTLLSHPAFASLRLLDLSETQVTHDAANQALKDVKQDLNFDFSTEDPPDGVLRVLVGKQIAKEPWELEMERKANAKKAAASQAALEDDWFIPASPGAPRAAASTEVKAKSPPAKTPPKSTKPKEVVKEAWEIEAEQGLLTEGGRRRARAAAAAQAQAQAKSTQTATSSDGNGTPTQKSPSTGLSSAEYFTHTTQTLKLPASAPATSKAVGHSRAFSMAAPSASSFSSTGAPSTRDLIVPTPTLPLSTIVAQPFAQSLRVLILANRRLDRSFELPVLLDNITASGFLPNLEELDLEGCNLNDLVPVHRAGGSDASTGTSSPPRINEPIIPTLSKLFPSLRTLNLSYNGLTNASLTSPALMELILASPQRKGLRHLRLRGNKISELDGFLDLAESFKGNREVPAWKMEELDLRDNEIGKLPPELGLLPLDVFLVDGNIFRVPQRRVWEREGTKGLLSWLRGRIE
ncbi:hypothetical protein JR316_0005361 [Psilocybe cubensis]|uniref:Uncharacterized protein n=1 Tax=Psilocybe cubensis TaxID=181762 RepID=A0ACB8H6H5_PSICU|nr:hypothetical protein JR316_0005361 [Psilocybe cubensis]KAH9483257.1 hypothetical protein JR316_0005361 [Psilocybe cubensis]